MNGGSLFTFSPAVSLLVSCGTQGEIDAYWEKLSEGGEKIHEFGLSWQIVPTALEARPQDKDAEKSMLQMKKLTLHAHRRR